ncbi:hypothetical protein [Stutzerimonas stutzeri]|uniref:hypothetical protein n=1 Tax=Stutzerimonas stutzeri TaxID=316 RepID=UPI00210F09B4|nr:hypothetical protein [Stutzerimonas stutzeri]MCQ4241913.1 hypothetical protein [Stutzerimonas stutzeri]
MGKTTEHIHVQWEGPFSYDDACKLRDGAHDYGIYQIYGSHPVYGSDVLIYIGKADIQTFGARLSQHHWHYTNQDKLTVYVGRLHGYGDTPADTQWSQQIAHVERLLIYSHWPAGNSSGLNVQLRDDFHYIHVLNWGKFRDLLPEVSGARYSNMYYSEEGYTPYKLEQHQPAQASEIVELLDEVAETL